MNKNLLIGAAVVLVIAIVGVMAFKNNKADAPTAEASTAVIQITSGQAYQLKDNGDRDKELKSGDTLTPPATIQVVDGGSAYVSFADGSVMRIQGGSTVTVKSADYDQASGKANTNIFVKIGRVWSKVVELATPDSTWTVETSSAVATVRGTAFDANVTADATVFAGSEREVSVAPIDPNTHARVEAAAQTMGEGKTVEVKNSLIADLISGKTKLVVADLSAAEKASAWFSANQSDDASFNSIIEQLRARGINGVELQSELRAKLRATSGTTNDDQSNDATDTDDQTGRGTLSDLWKSGKSQKCTFSYDYGQGQSEGTVYLANGKMRGDFGVTVAAGTAGNMKVESHMLRDKDLTYVWTSQSAQGFKFQTTGDVPGGLGDQTFDYNQMLNYHCTGFSGDNSAFALPAGITFTAFTIPTQR